MGFIGGFVIMGKDDMVFEGFGLNFPSVPIFSLLWPVICIDATCYGLIIQKVELQQNCHAIISRTEPFSCFMLLAPLIVNLLP